MPLTNLMNFMTPTITALNAIQVFNISYSHRHRTIRHPKSIIISLHRMLRLLQPRKSLLLRTVENAKTMQQGGVGHVNASGNLRLL